MIVVDTSVWVSRLIVREPQHLQSRQWLERYLQNTGSIAVPLLLLAEVAGALMRRTGRRAFAAQAIVGLESLADVRWFGLDKQLADAAAQAAINLRLRGADAVFVALAQQLGVPLVTWDQEQLTRGAAAITVYTPATAPTSPSLTVASHVSLPRVARYNRAGLGRTLRSGRGLDDQPHGPHHQEVTP